MSEQPTFSSREVALAIIPHFTGSLSLLGSGIIAGRVLLSRQKRQKTYHRLLCALSLCDLVSSFCYFLSTWPIPAMVPDAELGWKGTDRFAAVGNTASCTAQGFGIQFGVTSAFYNVMLSIHYILTIRYNFTENRLKTKVEPYMLSIPLIVGTALAVAGIFVDVYSDANLWCWIGPSVALCEGLDDRQCFARTNKMRWIFYYGPCWVCLFVITCLQVWLFITVRNTERKTRKYTQGITRHILKQSKATSLKSSNASSKPKPAKKQRSLTRDVAVQAAYYVGIFYVTWMPYTISSILPKWYQPSNNGFYLLLVIVILQPLQGFLNLFVYLRRTSIDFIKQQWSQIGNFFVQGVKRLTSTTASDSDSPTSPAGNVRIDVNHTTTTANGTPYKPESNSKDEEVAAAEEASDEVLPNESDVDSPAGRLSDIYSLSHIE